jgi:hypothetical protein
MKLGKKIGRFQQRTVLATYDLDVYFDVQSSEFSVLIPTAPGANVVKHDPNTWKCFTSKNLDDAKQEIAEFLRTRDVTDFVDIIEYNLTTWIRADENHNVYFDFRVARVSSATSETSGKPKLEKTIEVNDAGVIKEASFDDGRPYPIRSYQTHYDAQMPYTAERWKKCRAIRDGIDALMERLNSLFADNAADHLDTLLGNDPSLEAPLLLTTSEKKMSDS